MIAYDLDGTICSETKFKFDFIFYKLFGSLWGYTCKHNAKLWLKPTYQNFIIITARPESERWFTEKWLKNNHIYPKKLIMYKDTNHSIESIAKFKAQQIVKYNIFCYIDNDQKIIDSLRLLLSNEVKLIRYRR